MQRFKLPNQIHVHQREERKKMSRNEGNPKRKTLPSKCTDILVNERVSETKVYVKQKQKVISHHRCRNNSTAHTEPNIQPNKFQA